MTEQQPQAYISTGITVNTGSVELTFSDGPHIMPGFMVDQLGGYGAVTSPEFTALVSKFSWQEFAEAHFEEVASAGVNRMVGDLVEGYMKGLMQRSEQLRQQHNATVGVKIEQEDSARRGRLWQWFNK